MTDFPINRRQLLKASSGGILMSNLMFDQAAAQQIAPPGEAIIEGTVTDQFGNTLSGIDVNITPESGVVLDDGVTDSNGEYSFSLKPFNTYTVSVDEDGYKEFTDTVPLGSGDLFVLDISLINSTIFTVQQGSQSFEVTPLSNGQNIEDFYDFFDNEAHTTTDIEKSDVSHLFFWDGPNGISLVIIHDRRDDSSGGAVDFEFTGLPQEGSWVVRDDDPGNDNYSDNDTGYLIDWQWNSPRTDGGAFRGGLDSDFEITISPDFIFGINEWQLLSGNADNPDRIELEKNQSISIAPTKSPTTGTVAGTVADSDSNQLSDATVEFVDSSGNPVKSVSTNPDGSYETTLPAGTTYDVTVDKDGFQPESKQVTITQGKTNTVDFSLEELAALTIEDARLVQIVENTRIDSSRKGADEDDIDSSVSPETPDLILGRNTAVIFDIAGPSDISLKNNVEITVSGEDIPFVSAGSNSAQTSIINGSVISDVVSGSSLVEEFAKRPQFDLEPKDTLVDPLNDSYPVFEASDDISEIKIEISPQENRVSGDSVTLTRGSGAAGDFHFTSTPSLSIGFIAVDDYFGTQEYGQMDSDDYEDAIEKGVKYIRKVFPTTEVYYYKQSYNNGVQALAVPAPGSDSDEENGSDEDNIIGDVAEGITSAAISRDMAEARFELDRQTPAENIQKVSKSGIEDSSQEIEHFDVTIAITPSDYFEKLNMANVGGLHISSLTGLEQVQPRICACAEVDANNDFGETDGSTIMHEIGHHFLGEPFVGDIAQDTDRDKSPDPPDGRQGSDPAHAQDNLVSTKFDMSNYNAPSRPLRPDDDIDSAVSSYMSYKDKVWADSLSTQKLIDSANSDGFSPTPPENPVDLLPSVNNLIIFGEITDEDIEISFVDTLDQSIRTAGVEDGVDIQVRDNDNSKLVTQTLPQGLSGVFLDGEELEPPIVGENIVMGDIAFPAESAEVEITATSSSDGADNKLTKTIDTSSPVIADFSIPADSVIAKKPIVFDAGSSFVKRPGETIESYEWDWTNDGEFETETDIPSATHIYPTKGEYSVGLRVTDKNGNTATTLRTISVEPKDDRRRIEDYSENGQVKLSGLREAIADWRASEISDALLADVTAAWRSQDNIN